MLFIPTFWRWVPHCSAWPQTNKQTNRLRRLFAASTTDAKCRRSPESSYSSPSSSSSSWSWSSTVSLHFQWYITAVVASGVRGAGVALSICFTEADLQIPAWFDVCTCYWFVPAVVHNQTWYNFALDAHWTLFIKAELFNCSLRSKPPARPVTIAASSGNWIEESLFGLIRIKFLDYFPWKQSRSIDSDCNKVSVQHSWLFFNDLWG